VENIDMEVDEEVVSRMGCMAYWAYGSCLHDVAECPSGTHIWNDDIALEKEFDEVRGEGNLPLYSLDALQANLTLQIFFVLILLRSISSIVIISCSPNIRWKYATKRESSAEQKLNY
jgi:hypothetical protein